MTLTLPMMLFAALTSPDPLDALAERVISSRGSDPAAEAALREHGPRALEVLIAHRQAVALSAAELARIDVAIDRVAGQKYGSISRLFWFTDLELAREEARRTKRPILSLRMLGKLTEELSCANSRFFRTALYADPQIAAFMRDNFVMHWSSERDVPVMTIDLGDGRVLRRTITGNSIHYVLDDQARVLDAIPGLVAPATFLAELRFASSRPDRLRHAARARELAAVLSREVDRLGLSPQPIARGRAPAALAVRTAVSKAFVEAPALMSPVEMKALADDAWPKMTRLAGTVSLSNASLGLMRSQNPGLPEASFEAMKTKFLRSLAIDTVKNQLQLRRELHGVLAGRTQPPAFAELNEWVYRELFATPAGDPWLGLHDDAVYTGLDGAGLLGR